MVALPPSTSNAWKELPVSWPFPRFTVPFTLPRYTPICPPVDVTDVNPVHVGVLGNVALVPATLVPMLMAWPFVLIETSRALTMPTATPVGARIAVVELPIEKPASVLSRPSVTAAAALVIVTLVPVGLIAGYACPGRGTGAPSVSMETVAS